MLRLFQISFTVPLLRSKKSPHLSAATQTRTRHHEYHHWKAPAVANSTSTTAHWHSRPRVAVPEAGRHGSWPQLQAKDGSVPGARRPRQPPQPDRSHHGLHQGAGPALPARRRATCACSSRTSHAGQHAAWASRTSLTRCWPSTRRNTASTAWATWWCSPCTPRTAQPPATWRPCWWRSSGPNSLASWKPADYSNKLFVPLRFIDFTPGYDTQLRRAVPGKRLRARNAHLHLGRHLPGPRGRPLPPRGARGSGRDPAGAAGRRPGTAGQPGPDHRKPLSCGI